MKRILALTLSLITILAALSGCMASQTSLSGVELFSKANIKTVTFSSDPNGYQYSFHGSSVQQILDYFSSLKFVLDSTPYPSDVTGMSWDITIEYENDHSETLHIQPNRTHISKDDAKYKLTSGSTIEIDVLIDSLKDVPGEQNPSGQPLPMTMTIAETLPSCVAFEYQDGKPYCFYAYDTEGKSYRVFWTNFEGLNEKDRIVVEYYGLEKLTYDEYPGGGWTPQYEITATHVKLESDVLASCLSHKDGVYTLALPKSGQTVELKEEYTRFVPYITDALVEAAENKITEEIAKYDNHSGFYLQITEDYLCLTVEVIKQLDEPDESVGCIDHEHIFYSECISSQSVKDNDKVEFGTSDEEYKKIQFFQQPILEFTEESYDLTEFESSLLSDDDMELLRQVYNDGKGWTNDSVVDRTAFYFDGRIRFATEGSAGWMYFGFDQNVLYYNGMFTSMNEKVRDMLDSERISSQGEKEESSSDNSLTKSSVIYFSGENKTSALSALLLLNQVIMSNKRNARRIYTQ